MTTNDVPMMIMNYYECPRCNHDWENAWSSRCVDYCPACEQDSIEPQKSEPLLKGASL